MVALEASGHGSSVPGKAASCTEQGRGRQPQWSPWVCLGRRREVGRDNGKQSRQGEGEYPEGLRKQVSIRCGTLSFEGVLKCLHLLL